jgi:hypothetical protein
MQQRLEMPKLVTTSDKPGDRRARVLTLSSAQLLLIQNAAELTNNPSAFYASVSNLLTNADGQLSTHDVDRAIRFCLGVQGVSVGRDFYGGDDTPAKATPHHQPRRRH